jgi:hypothetical protein
MKRRPVFRVCVSWGQRPRPHEYAFEAPTAIAAARLGLLQARADGFPRPHEVDAVLHLCDLDHTPNVKHRRKT